MKKLKQIIKNLIVKLKEFFDDDGLYSIDGLYFGDDVQKENDHEYDNPLDCRGFYMSNTEINYGKSDFYRYK